MRKWYICVSFFAALSVLHLYPAQADGGSSDVGRPVLDDPGDPGVGSSRPFTCFTPQHPDDTQQRSGGIDPADLAVTTEPVPFCEPEDPAAMVAAPLIDEVNGVADPAGVSTAIGGIKGYVDEPRKWIYQGVWKYGVRHEGRITYFGSYEVFARVLVGEPGYGESPRGTVAMAWVSHRSGPEAAAHLLTRCWEEHWYSDSSCGTRSSEWSDMTTSEREVGPLDYYMAQDEDYHLWLQLTYRPNPEKLPVKYREWAKKNGYWHIDGNTASFECPGKKSRCKFVDES